MPRPEFLLLPTETFAAVNEAVALLQDTHYALPTIAVPKHLSGKHRSRALLDAKTSALEDSFTAIHKRLFSDTHYSDNPLLTPGKVTQSAIDFRFGVLEKMAERLYDNAGNVRRLTIREMAELLAETHSAMLRLKPFSYGNVETSAVFAVLIARSAGRELDLSAVGTKNVLEQSLILIPETGSKEALIQLFTRCLSGKTLTQPAGEQVAYKALPPEWRPIDDGAFPAASPRFVRLYKDFGEGKEAYLLLENGGLIAEDKVTGPLECFKVNRDEVTHYTDPSLAEKTAIDGVPVPEKLSLFRLDIDRMTGLDKQELAQLDKLMARGKVAGLSLNSYMDIPKHASELRGVVHTEEERQMLEKANARLHYIVPEIERIINEHTETVTPVEKPHYYVTVGGSGAGKGKLLEEAMQRTKGNAIIASLDDARTFFDAWKFNAGHGIDYPHLLQCASIVRNACMGHAFATGKHLIRDCSGVPYAREAEIIAKVDDKGREITLLATTATVETALKRSYHRLYDENHQQKPHGRGLTPSILTRKHVEVSQEFSKFLHNPRINTLQLYDNNGDAQVLIGQKFSVETAHLHQLKEAAAKGRLGEVFKASGLAEHRGEAPLDSQNCSLLVMEEKDSTAEIFVIYDDRHFSQFLSKGLLNKDAKVPGQLYENRLAYYVPPQTMMRKSWAEKENNAMLASLSRTGYRDAVLKNSFEISGMER